MFVRLKCLYFGKKRSFYVFFRLNVCFFCTPFVLSSIRAMSIHQPDNQVCVAVQTLRQAFVGRS